MMWGSVMVGNYLSVDVSGRGSVSSFPVNFLCRGNCGLGVPDGAEPVALVATPKLGYVFDRWEGACSGNGECSLNVTGLLQTRAVFREVSAGAISQVKVTKAKKKRTVAVTVTLTDPAMTTIQVRARREPRHRPDEADDRRRNDHVQAGRPEGHKGRRGDRPGVVQAGDVAEVVRGQPADPDSEALARDGFEHPLRNIEVRVDVLDVEKRGNPWFPRWPPQRATASSTCSGISKFA